MKYIDPRNPWAVVLILVAAMFACGLLALLVSSSSAPTSSPPTARESVPSIPSEPLLTPAPGIAYQPTFEPAPCAFPVPHGYRPECGYLVVPANRARPD